MNRFPFIALLVIIAFSCNNSKKESGMKEEYKTGNNNDTVKCKISYDSALLRYSDSFVASTIDLNESLNDEFKNYVLSLDTTCLRQQENYKYFIITMMAKLYLYHLKCCNQGYDLYQMTGNPAKIIINEFERIGKYERSQNEMLNSGMIVDVIAQDSSLKRSEKIDELVKKISVESKRILN
jgi:hypothetical protein